MMNKPYMLYNSLVKLLNELVQETKNQCQIAIEITEPFPLISEVILLGWGTHSWRRYASVLFTF